MQKIGKYMHNRFLNLIRSLKEGVTLYALFYSIL